MTSQKGSSDLTKSLNLNYGRILLTLENCLLSEDKLLQTPSRLDGLTSNIETALRILGCELIQTAGILLKLPQVAMATGQVLFQRFYYSKSFVRHSMETTAMACICLASKIEEAPRRVRDVINVFNHIKQLKDEKTIEPLILDQFYINLKNQVIKAERRVLKELGFCVHVKHPHKLIVMFLQVLNCEKNAKLMQLAWNYMNDALRTDVFMKYQPETVACACIYLTARKLHMSLPKNPDWFSIFRVTRDDIHNVCFAVLNLYARGKPDALELERAIQELRLHYQEERSKARSSSSGKNSPADTNSPGGIQERPSGGSHNAWGGFISRSGSHHVPSTETEKKKIKSKTPSPGRSPSNRSSKKYRRHRSRSLTKSRTQSPNDRKQKSHKSQHTQRKHSRSRSGSPSRKNKKHR